MIRYLLLMDLIDWEDGFILLEFLLENYGILLLAQTRVVYDLNYVQLRYVRPTHVI